MPTVPLRCSLCSRGAEPLRGRVLPLPFGRIRICRTCREVVCRRHSVKVGKGEVECATCRAATTATG